MPRKHSHTHKRTLSLVHTHTHTQQRRHFVRPGVFAPVTAKWCTNQGHHLLPVKIVMVSFVPCDHESRPRQPVRPKSSSLSLFQWSWPLPNYNLDHFCKFLYMTTVCTRKVRRLRRKTRSQENQNKTEGLKRCKTAAPRWLQYKYKRQYKVWQLSGQDDRGV